MESVLELLLSWRSSRQSKKQDREAKKALRIQQLSDLVETFMYLSDAEVCETLWINHHSSLSSFEAILGYRTLRVQIVYDRGEASVYIAPPSAKKPFTLGGPWVSLSSILSSILQDELGPRSAMIYDGPNARRRHLEDWSRLIQQHWLAIVNAVNDR
jgi:hypothetical protein